MSNTQLVKMLNKRPVKVFKVALVLELVLALALAASVMFTVFSNTESDISFVLSSLYQLGKIGVLFSGLFIPLTMCFGNKRELLIKTLGLKGYRKELVKNVYKMLGILLFVNVSLSILTQLSYMTGVVYSEYNYLGGMIYGTIITTFGILTVLNVGFWALLTCKETYDNSNVKYLGKRKKTRAMISLIINIGLILGIGIIFLVIQILLDSLSFNILYIANTTHALNPLGEVFVMCIFIILNYLMTSYYQYNNKNNVGL